jgi:hypothetical protein
MPWAYTHCLVVTPGPGRFIFCLEPISKLIMYNLSCPHVVSGHPEGLENTGFPVRFDRVDPDPLSQE